MGVIPVGLSGGESAFIDVFWILVYHIRKYMVSDCPASLGDVKLISGSDVIRLTHPLEG